MICWRDACAFLALSMFCSEIPLFFFRLTVMAASRGSWWDSSWDTSWDSSWDQRWEGWNDWGKWEAERASSSDDWDGWNWKRNDWNWKSDSWTSDRWSGQISDQDGKPQDELEIVEVVETDQALQIKKGAAKAKSMPKASKSSAPGPKPKTAVKAEPKTKRVPKPPAGPPPRSLLKPIVKPQNVLKPEPRVV